MQSKVRARTRTVQTDTQSPRQTWPNALPRTLSGGNKAGLPVQSLTACGLYEFCVFLQRAAKLGLQALCAAANPSVRLSVRRSVTLRYFVKTTERRWMRYLPSDSPVSLVRLFVEF